MPSHHTEISQSEDPGQVTYHLEEQGAVHQSKEVLTLLSHTFFMHLYFTFQDKDNLCMLAIQRSWTTLVRGSCLVLSVLWLSLLGWWITVSQGVCLPWPSFALNLLKLSTSSFCSAKARLLVSTL